MKNFLGILSIFSILLLFSCNNDSMTFTAPSEVEVGAEVLITYSSAIPSTEANRCWIAIVKKDSPESTWGDWKYVEDKATSQVLTAPAEAGDYEIRLHDNYPAKKYHLVVKQDLTVK